MAQTAAQPGICEYCGDTFTKRGMTRHLMSCPARKKALDAAAHDKPIDWYVQMRVEAEGLEASYWMDLELRASGTMRSLDNYLRKHWLECCGHLSHFQYGPIWHGEPIAKGRRVGPAIPFDLPFYHIYDYGETSICTLRAIRVYRAPRRTRNIVKLLAQNVPPVFPCMVCGEPATQFCTECRHEHHKSGMLCDRHAAEHSHRNYGPLRPIVNSPRLAMCGYVAPGLFLLWDPQGPPDQRLTIGPAP